MRNINVDIKILFLFVQKSDDGIKEIIWELVYFYEKLCWNEI